MVRVRRAPNRCWMVRRVVLRGKYLGAGAAGAIHVPHPSRPSFFFRPAGRMAAAVGNSASNSFRGLGKTGLWACWLGPIPGLADDVNSAATQAFWPLLTFWPLGVMAAAVFGLSADSCLRAVRQEWLFGLSAWPNNESGRRCQFRRHSSLSAVATLLAFRPYGRRCIRPFGRQWPSGG